MQIKATRGHFSHQTVKILKIWRCWALELTLGGEGCGGLGDRTKKAHPLLTTGGFYKLNMHAQSIASSLRSF